jgi:hypothetical protein
VQPGEPFRLFPFGRIVKNGQVRELTRALAEKIRLPHFKPPIKLGSHEEPTPAGGHIIALEVRDDGLWAVPEFTEKGVKALVEGDFRYHSPEIIWDGWLEDPETGEKLEGPMIVGDALLHTPHLGEASALYQFVKGDETMTTHEDMVSVSTLDKIMSWFQNQPAKQEPEPAQTPEPQEDYAAQIETLQAEREAYAAKVAEYEAAQKRQARVDEFAAQFEGVQVDKELFGILADIPEEAGEYLTKFIKALAAQAEAAHLTEDVGNPGDGAEGDPEAALHAAVLKVMSDKSISYPQALDVVRAEQPDVFHAYAGGN